MCVISSFTFVSVLFLYCFCSVPLLFLFCLCQVSVIPAQWTLLYFHICLANAYYYFFFFLLIWRYTHLSWNSVFKSTNSVQHFKQTLHRPCPGLTRFQESETPMLQDNLHMKEGSLSSLLIVHLYPEEIFQVLIYVGGWTDPRLYNVLQ